MRSEVLLLIYVGAGAIQLCKNSDSEIIWENTLSNHPPQVPAHPLGISRNGVTWET